MAKKKGKVSLDAAAEGFSSNPFASLANRSDLPAPAPEPEASKAEPEEVLDLSKTRIHTNIEKKGRGGKTVTLIGGLDGLPAKQHEQLVAALKKGLGVGVSTEDTVIVVQGDQRPRLAGVFEKFGYKEKK